MRKGLRCLIIPMLLTGVVASWAAENPLMPDTSAAANPLSRTPPLIRGTLWWINHNVYAEWGRIQFEEAIEAQRTVGFDVLWILNSPALLQLDEDGDNAKRDILAMIYAIADAKRMHVIADLPRGGWYGQTAAEDMIAELSGFASRLHARYGRHPSFYGWYLNHEINPIRPDDREESAYWRQVWKGAAEACHRVAPGSVVTISPFFLLDEARKRGFVT